MEVMAPLSLALLVIGSIIIIVAMNVGPKATLAASLGAILLGAMFGVVARAAAEMAPGWFGVGCLMAGLLGVLACALNKWLPR